MLSISRRKLASNLTEVSTKDFSLEAETCIGFFSELFAPSDPKRPPRPRKRPADPKGRPGDKDAKKRKFSSGNPDSKKPKFSFKSKSGSSGSTKKFSGKGKNVKRKSKK